MRFGRLGQLKHGYNAMTTRESDMLMDIGYQEMDENEIVEFEDPLQETAFVITTGDVDGKIVLLVTATMMGSSQLPMLSCFRNGS